MDTIKRAIATTEVVLMFPVMLFMSALVVRGLAPLASEPALTAERIVMWYAGRQWTLWILLVALPFSVLVTGSALLLRVWNGDASIPNHPRQTIGQILADPTTLVVALLTLTAFGVLVRVALHILAN